jgi:hydrogenase maturation protein HypF
MDGAEFLVQGRVQGVGFRPTVWRLARECGLSGDVRNDAAGVLIRVAGDDARIARFLERLRREPPPLARIERIERRPIVEPCRHGFHIVTSTNGEPRTQVAPDAVICAECAREVLDPGERRHRYAFTNCTHCGPRFSVVCDIPYDRATTTMARFALCAACQSEYATPAARRFHAEAIACADCGPRLSDDLVPVVEMLLRGGIVALKGIGGYQLACDATNAAAVTRLRSAKHRETKPFALMGRDLGVVHRYCAISTAERRQLTSPEGPIVVLRASGERLPDAVAPGLSTLGFMLPTTPLHLLLLHNIDRPVVMTSGNLSDEPQIIDDGEARERLGRIADLVLTHDRDIATRIDDSVVRVMAGAPRILRRARGYAPGAVPLPFGFEAAPDLLAAGGEQKNSFCLLKDGAAILSQHIGDLDDAQIYDDYQRNIAHYAALFHHRPMAIAADPHPEYLSSKYARDCGLPLIEVQHHHAHVAACLAENGRPLDAPPALGIVLDGLGWGEDSTIWGGEFLLADYRSARRLAMFKPVAMPGGTAAVREPWRNLYAHLAAAGLPQAAHPTLDAMIASGINSPLASSCGRLFDAMAAALNICRDRQGHEGEAASRLEALVCQDTLECEQGYRLEVSNWIDPTPLWHAVLHDLHARTPRPVMAARFHKGVADAVVEMARRLSGFDTVALSGGCFQNAVLFELIERRLRETGFCVLAHSAVPANDGGLSLGQAAVAAAQLLASPSSFPRMGGPRDLGSTSLAPGSRLRGNDGRTIQATPGC